MRINTFNDLVEAIQNGKQNIIITRNILCNYSLLLPDNVNISGQEQENGQVPLLSFQNSDGIGISSNNTIKNLNIDVPSNHKAIFNTTVRKDLGVFNLENLQTTGQVSIITRVGVKTTKVKIQNLNIIASDSRFYLEQPQKYGVNVLQGALTIYNINPDEESILEVQAENVSIGQKNAPVSGSGIFICGFGDTGGKTHVKKLQTNSVYSNGKIPLGVADYITGGVFICYGAHADEVITDGEIVTYGVNDMVLDVWGSVENWTSNAPIISYGPSGVGFVNFGTVKNFIANAPLQTYGLGARGYNQYDGTVENITFKSIETFGDGSVGIQISKAIGNLTVNENVSTWGSIGSSLVKGVYVDLPAYAFSIKNGGSAKNITIKGNLQTFGDEVTTYIVEEGGNPGELQIEGKLIAKGKNSKTK